MKKKSAGTGMLKMAGIAIGVIAVIIVAYLWFFILNPSFVAKPEIEKPSLDVNNIEPGNVNWILNELGVYKLHADPASGELPEIELHVEDNDETFTTVVEDNVPSTTENGADNPDIEITLSSDDFAELYDSDNIQGDTSSLYDEGEISMNLVKDMDVLAFKGYKVIYDEFYS